MTIIKLSPDNFESFSVITNPKRSYSSSSAGITGSINLFRQSKIEKDIQSTKDFNQIHFKDIGPEMYRYATRRVVKDSIVSGTYGNFNPALSVYLNLINNEPLSRFLSQSVFVKRVVPDNKIEQNFLKFQTFKDQLLKRYRAEHNISYGFTNYNSLNFFTASSLPSNSAIIYPNSASNANAIKASGSYMIDKGFSFNFYINPRYEADEPNTDFKAGTIFHLSSSYAVSLITGSLRDVNGKQEGFRLMVQLSHSADVAPSNVNLNSVGNYPNDLIFISNDNSLRKNNWHNCTIRWGNNINDRSGSFVIDNEEAGTFSIPSSSIRPQAFSAPQGNPSALVIGNHYEGSNSGTGKQILLFAETPSIRDGITQMHPNSSAVEPEFSLNHPLNAELHDLKIYNEYINDTQIYSSSFAGTTLTDNLIFYVPPFFVRESPKRKVSSGAGGVLASPFVAEDKETNSPINSNLSFRVGTKDINLENFTRDFAQNNYPRLLNLTSSFVSVSDDERIISASAFMYSTGSFVKRNLTILPCDNGKFIPNFDLLKSGTIRNVPKKGTPTIKFTNDLNNLDLSLVSLRNIIDSGSFPEFSVAQRTLSEDGNTLRAGTFDDAGDIRDDLMGPEGAPGRYDGDLGAFMAIHYDTRDEDSREIVLFDISNIFYGQKIEPGTFEMTDNNLSGSNEKISITIKDDGNGKLYRANSITPNAEFNQIGAIFYNEGIIGLFQPSLTFFGENQYEISFKGRQSVHTQKISLLANAGQINSSSNPTYNPLISASLDANDSGESFVLISDLLFMDDNLNVVAKSALAQPITKKQSDRILFRTKIDW